MNVRTLTAFALLAVLGTALAQPPKPAEPEKPLQAGSDKPQPGAKADRADIRKRLDARVNQDRYEGKFRDAVSEIASAYDLPLVLTRAAEQGTVNADEGDLRRGDMTVRLPKLTNVKVETVLTLLCEQTDTRFLVYPDHLRIVPDVFAVYESGVLPAAADPNAEEAPLLTTSDLLRAKPLTKRGLVNLTFKAKPLSEALDEIAETTGANVALAPALPGAVRQAPVTVRFANTPVDAAVRTLCEMTEAGVIEDANVLLVTTRERADARAKEDAQKLKDRQPPAPVFGLGGVAGPFHQPADPSAEIAKLREQNDQLAKRLDQIGKQLDELKAKK